MTAGLPGFQDGSLLKGARTTKPRRNPTMRTIRLSLLTSCLVAVLSTPAAWGICTFGTFGDDTMYGTSGADCLDGNPGNDLIFGYGGDDGLNGFTGDDRIYGGDGNDFIGGCGCYGANPTADEDTLSGGSGDDRFDYLDGGAGTDTCYGEVEVDCEI
jgi:hypothetical protein